MAGFTYRHRPVRRVLSPDGLELLADDGARAELIPWTPIGTPPDTGGLRDWAGSPARLGLILIRRGGYAIGLAQGDELVAHHCGTRYVQGKTKAGGSSQQRFARRRANQADALIGAAVGRVEQVIGMVDRRSVDGLVIGGDRQLCRQVLEALPRRAGDRGGLTPTGAATELPRREFFDVPDPRFAVLQETLQRSRAVRVHLDEGPPASRE